jgi:hypothetical protein
VNGTVAVVPDTVTVPITGATGKVNNDATGNNLVAPESLDVTDTVIGYTLFVNNEDNPVRDIVFVGDTVAA